MSAAVTDGAAIPQQAISAFEALEATDYNAGVIAEQDVHQRGIDAWAALAASATDPNVQAVALANRDSASTIADDVRDAHIININFGDSGPLNAMDAILTEWETYNAWALTQSSGLQSFDQWRAP